MVRRTMGNQPPRRAERTRARQRTPADAMVPERPEGDELPDRGLTESACRRLSATTCGWCGGPITPKARGRIPTWCSPACRQRAWEQKRAAASGLAAVRVVERRVEIPVPTPAPAQMPRHQEWAAQLRQLTTQLDDGSLYDRDLPTIAAALDEVLVAFGRRTRHP